LAKQQETNICESIASRAFIAIFPSSL